MPLKIAAGPHDSSRPVARAERKTATSFLGDRPRLAPLAISLVGARLPRSKKESHPEAVRPNGKSVMTDAVVVFAPRADESDDLEKLWLFRESAMAPSYKLSSSSRLLSIMDAVLR